MTDDAAHRSPTQRAQSAAVGQHCAADCTGAGAELPAPEQASGQTVAGSSPGCREPARVYDLNGDGVFNVVDYADDPRVSDLNGDGAVDRGDFRPFADGADNDGDGYVDDLSGWDAADNDGDEFDDRYFGHGTGRAGIAAPETDNGLGVAGVDLLEGRDGPVVLEVNASPERLDLSDVHARRAGELGIPIAVSTDTHYLSNLDHVHLGIGTGRRAWLGPGQVLNTRPVEELLAWAGERMAAMAEAARVPGCTGMRRYAALPVEERPWRLLWYQDGPYAAYYHTGRYQDVINLANTTLFSVDKPVLEETYYWRGMTKAALGDRQGALEDLQRAYTLNPNSTPAGQALQQLSSNP